ncbi:hypothetical protein L682_10980 [Aquipseudomonas alcaligenes OT 69]|nr:hypothetical protein L682_10980 [Pseudomonas alcaligenes OT 69]
MSVRTYYWIAAAAAICLAPKVFLPVLLGVGVLAGVALVGLGGAAVLFQPRKH